MKSSEEKVLDYIYTIKDSLWRIESYLWKMRYASRMSDRDRAYHYSTDNIRRKKRDQGTIERRNAEAKSIGFDVQSVKPKDSKNT